MRSIINISQNTLSCAVAGSIFMSAFPAFAANAAQILAPHRAIYDVTLKQASDRSGINGMSGRIVYEFRGTPCDGYTTSFRFVNRVSARGESNVTDQRTSTYEDASGENFRFVTKTYVNDRKDREIEGRAIARNGETSVTLSKPEEVNLALPTAKFPTAQILEVMERADAGETFFELPIFDGSDGGDRVLSTTIIASGKKTGEDSDKDVIAALGKNEYRKITMSYFDKTNETEALPEYTISFKLHDNGVSRDLEMDYGDFVLKGKITELELFEPESCETGAAQ